MESGPVTELFNSVLRQRLFSNPPSQNRIGECNFLMCCTSAQPLHSSVLSGSNDNGPTAHDYGAPTSLSEAPLSEESLQLSKSDQ